MKIASQKPSTDSSRKFYLRHLTFRISLGLFKDLRTQMA